MKDVGCSQSAVSKIWTKNKQYGEVVKWKHKGRHQNVKIENLKENKQKMSNKTNEKRGQKLNCKKSPKRNWVGIQKSQTSVSITTQTEENEKTVGMDCG